MGIFLPGAYFWGHILAGGIFLGRIFLGAYSSILMRERRHDVSLVVSLVTGTGEELRARGCGTGLLSGGGGASREG